MSKDFKTAMEERRSVYSINNETTIEDEKIIDIVENSTKYVPSAFHSQSQRVVVLFGENHKKLWSIVMETLRKIVPKDKFDETEAKINSFAVGHGTVLYFDSANITDGFGDKFPLYRENFKIWAQQSNGMLQYAIWTQLEAEGLGVSLQHYNPIIDDEVKEVFNLPKDWILIAQMPFGKQVAAPSEKEFVDIKERVMVFK